MNNDTKTQIIEELITTITKLSDKSDLLSIVCSYDDTLSDEEYLKQLSEWNSLNSTNNS